MRSADRRLLDEIPDRLLPGEVVTVDQARCLAMVLIDVVDGGRSTHGPCPYTPIVTGSSCPGLTAHHPKRGTRCLVVEDARDGLWVAQWALS